MHRIYGPAMALSNLVGAGVVFVFLAYLLPVAPENLASADAQRALNLIAFVAYMVCSQFAGWILGGRLSAPINLWLGSERAAGDMERESALHLPWRQAKLHALLWMLAGVVFGGINVGYSSTLAGEVTGTIVLGGFTTCALGYLVAERALRPVVGAVMATTADAPPRVLGLRMRVLLAWGLGTGIPLFGVLLGLLQLGDRAPLPQTAQVFLVAVAAVVGVLAIAAVAGAVSDPVGSVAAALREVGSGNLDVTVPVYDGSEVGQLQSGFNAMVKGLRERERLRDLFGRQVGPEVAKLAFEQGVRLGGQRREVAVLFVDVIGSTALAQSSEPEQVVEVLNGFFGIVVEVVSRYGGWVNKFAGDASLCVFGAPVDLPDSAGCALSAARELALRLRPLPLDAGLGVSAGPVVAGHIGAESRFEYTVVGDAVNAAARLSELAKNDPRRLLADEAAVQRANGPEQAFWSPAGEAVLRGRTSATRMWAAAPAVSSQAAASADERA